MFIGFLAFLVYGEKWPYQDTYLLAYGKVPIHHKCELHASQNILMNLFPPTVTSFGEPYLATVIVTEY